MVSLNSKNRALYPLPLHPATPVPSLLPRPNNQVSPSKQQPHIPPPHKRETAPNRQLHNRPLNAAKYLILPNLSNFCGWTYRFGRWFT
ncbi:hypothetical protein P154DRAFT_41338 [Amniculicola lignicola CBS 123094]|uniref:Uncharacterized protein n=1 Tax=Amniculicola lignicola CBS 123094 TaxID=1392246 RepID=A0A6A5W4E4_9PLEO|nr:hypothetical protein P154DRAFT_41338 [Amniculicola lignicola CBS 123094]